MGPPPTDKVLLKGVAAIVHDLVEFSPVHELFQTHLKRWRKKNALIVAQRRKAEAQLAKFWREEPKAADSDEYELWPERTIYSPDRTNRKIVRIPQELDRALRKPEDPDRYYLLGALDDKLDWTPTEYFTLLAEIRDSAYPEFRFEYAKDHIDDVAKAINLCANGLSQGAAKSLERLVEKVLDQIEWRADANARNEAGERLQQIIQRSRKKLADLVKHSRQHFVTHTDRESVQDVVEKLSDVTASLEAHGRRLAKQSQIEADRHQQQQTTSVKAGGKTGTPPKKPTPKQGVSLRSAAEILAQRGGERIGTVDEILKKFRKFSREFQATGFALNMKNKPLYSVPTMAKLIVKCGYADSEKVARQNLKAKLEVCRDS